jgi:hypothetical protein
MSSQKVSGSAPLEMTPNSRAHGRRLWSTDSELETPQPFGDFLGKRLDPEIVGV